MTRTPVAPLRVRWTRRADGNVILLCTRADGTTTWQRHTRHAAFFAFHDLRHFAVESVLGLTDAFFGLIAQGWDIGDTEGSSARGPLPPNALHAEHLVGFLDRAQVGGAAEPTAADVNAHMAALHADGKLAVARQLRDGELAAIRECTAQLQAAYAATQDGAAFELTFDPAPLPP